MSDPVPASIDRSNWLAHPRASFWRVPEFLPTATIAAATPAPLPRGSALLDGIALPRPDGTALDLPSFFAKTATDAWVVLKDGVIVHEWHVDGHQAADRHIFMSMSKAVVGLVVGVLASRGVLRPEDPVSRHVPEVAHSVYGTATIRDLVDMRADVRFDVAQQADYDHATHWRPTERGGPADLHAFYAGLAPATITHGTPFRYVSANIDLVAWAIERATGQRFADVVADTLWRPMGAAADGYVTTDERGNARATGGIGGTVLDLARLGHVAIEGRSITGDVVVPGAWIDDLATGGDVDAWKRGEWGRAFTVLAPEMRYRSGWYVVDGEAPMLFGMGIHGQNVFVDRAARLVIAKLSSQKDAMDYAAVGLTHRVVREIRRRLA